MVPHRLRLQTVTAHWRAFLAAIRQLAIAGLFPTLEWQAVAYRPYKATHARVSRDQFQGGTLADASMVPGNLDARTDSYHTELLVPLSIHLNDDAYLRQYERTLTRSIEAFDVCAERELRALKRRFQLGQAYIQSVDYGAIMRTLDGRRNKRGDVAGFVGGYTDPETGHHYFNPKGGHPRLIRHLVAMVFHEMGGLPKPWLINGKCVGPPQWMFVRDYGKTKLFPYVGILTARAAAPFIVLLLLENPRITVESLLNAKLDDKYGRTLLFSKAGDDGTVLRLTVEKPRARRQQHGCLSERGVEIFQWLMRFTEPVRRYLRAHGRDADARWLWLGATSSRNHDYGRLCFSQLTTGFHARLSKQANKRGRQRTLSFVESHAELASWIGTARLRSIRVSKGVAVWFRSDGDPVQTAQAFGHRGLQVTLSNYVPNPIQNAMYERHVRRWQNLVICAASPQKSYLLAATDFSTTDQLHEFLRGLLAEARTANRDVYDDTLLANILAIVEPDAMAKETLTTEHGDRNRQVLIMNDPDRVAVLLLYREHLLPAPNESLDRRDATTQSSPRMWLELASALCGNMLDDQIELRQLVSQARCRANDLRNHVQFAPV